MAAEILIGFWVLLLITLEIWPCVYYMVKNVPTLTALELEKRSPIFAGLEAQYRAGAIRRGGGLGVMLLGLALFPFIAEVLWHIPLTSGKIFGGLTLLILFYTLFAPFFALFKGVYPVASKSHTPRQYIYQPTNLVRQLSQIQIALPVSVAAIAPVVGWLT
jgi:hypothetical protein